MQLGEVGFNVTYEIPCLRYHLGIFTNEFSSAYSFTLFCSNSICEITVGVSMNLSMVEGG